MKTGIIRRIDDLGRIAIPKEIRRILDIDVGDPLELSLDGDKVVFERYLPAIDLESNIMRLIHSITEHNYDGELSPEELKVISLLKEACVVLKEEQLNRHS